MRFCAVDWSGAISGERQSIWSATVGDGTVEWLETGRSRPETIQYLVDLANEDPDLVVGLDFGFSFPAWFFAEHKLESVEELWELVAREGEGWLANCEAPFWVGPARPAHFLRRGNFENRAGGAANRVQCAPVRLQDQRRR